MFVSARALVHVYVHTLLPQVNRDTQSQYIKVILGISGWRLTDELYYGLAEWSPPWLKYRFSILVLELYTCKCFKDFPRNKVHVLLWHVFDEYEYDWFLQQVGVFYFIATVSALTVVL